MSSGFSNVAKGMAVFKFSNTYLGHHDFLKGFAQACTEGGVGEGGGGRCAGHDLNVAKYTGTYTNPWILQRGPLPAISRGYNFTCTGCNLAIYRGYNS